MKNKTKRWLASISVAAISASMLAGCGKGGSTEEENNDAAPVYEIEDAADEVTPDYINDFEERVHKISFESYDEIISLLEGSEGYAYVNVKGYDGDVLAVATYTYDDMMGNMESTECTFYTIKRDGTVSADAVLTSSGTATPVSIDDEGIIYTVTHRSVDRFCYGMDIPDGVGMICMSQLRAETFDDDGHPTSIWGYYRTSNTVANDDNLVTIEANDIDFYNKIFDEYYDKSQPIYFTLASFSLKDYEGLYYKTEIEELEYYDVTHTTGYQFNSDGTGIYYGQDAVDFTWNENGIHFVDNTVNFVMESGKLKIGDITYDKMEGRLINPSVFEIDPNNVEDGCYLVKIERNGINESDGQTTIKAEVYNEDIYDIADINSVAEGDVIYLKGELVPVNSIQWEDSKCVDINGGSDNDGITLSSNRYPDYFRYIGQYEMDRSYSYIETIELNVRDDVKFTDSIDPADAKEYTGVDAIAALKEIVVEGPLFYDSGEIMVENGEIVEIYRNYVS